MKKEILNSILVLRLGSLGDVALAVPVLEAVAKAYPDKEFVLITKQEWAAVLPANNSFKTEAIDFKKDYKGIGGIFKLYQYLKKKYTPTAIADLHNVFRTKILRAFFALSGIPVATIEKGRAEKKALTRKHEKVLKQLPHATARYASVFAELGFPVGEDLLKTGEYWKVVSTHHPIIGIAPFAKWEQKVYPLPMMEKVIEMLDANGMTVFVFGGGKEERAIAEAWGGRFKNLHSKISIPKEEELKALKSCSLLLSMDSANMHLASLMGVPVLSIWGPTHPFAGFTGFRQNPQFVIQDETLVCRPCSAFGDKPCFREQRYCMNNISPETVVKKVLDLVLL